MSFHRSSFQRGLELIVVLILFFSASADADEIKILLSGDPAYPGILSVKTQDFSINRLCFLGAKAPGNIDADFLKNLAESGVPEGTYSLANPSAEERWPTRSFSRGGAIRFRPVGEEPEKKLAHSDKRGLAVHGRDFYPLIENRIARKSMIAFHNETLFERLRQRWGTLRLSNWDMNRLHDFWKSRNGENRPWKIVVSEENPANVGKICKPPEVKRK